MLDTEDMIDLKEIMGMFRFSSMPYASRFVKTCKGFPPPKVRISQKTRFWSRQEVEKFALKKR